MIWFVPPIGSSYLPSVESLPFPSSRLLSDNEELPDDDRSSFSATLPLLCRRFMAFSLP
jgi:hypothetical protein